MIKYSIRIYGMKVNLTFNQQVKTTVEIRKVIISSHSVLKVQFLFLTFNYEFDFRDWYGLILSILDMKMIDEWRGNCFVLTEDVI